MGQSHRNEYYKQLVAKRLQAYEAIESIVSALKGAVLDDTDRTMYHMIFAKGTDKFYQFHLLELHSAFLMSFWMSKKTTNAMTRIDRLLVDIERNYDLKTELVKAGKEQYKTLATLRDDLESSLRNDFSRLHKISSFLTASRDHDVFRPIEEQFESKKLYACTTHNTPSDMPRDAGE